MKILLVEDDEKLIKLLTKILTPHHYILDVVKDGEMGWNYGSSFEYDLIMLDIVLPKLDGISLCKRFRTEGFITPILLLTGQDTITAKVQGLDAGADDCVVKPFDRAELIARIRALLRRSSTNPLPLLTWGDLLLNLNTCEVSYNGQNLTLSTKEYELLELLLRDSQHVYSTEELLERLWSSEQFPSEATVRSHIRRVRQKLASVGAPKDFISTVHGRGYYLKAPVMEGSTILSSALPQGGIGNTLDMSSVAEVLSDTRQQLPAQKRSRVSQQQYLEFLNDTWATTKLKALEQLRTLSQTVQALQSNQLSPEQQKQAQQIAHKLAGTLEIFELTKAMHSARQLERYFDSKESLHPHHVQLMQTLVSTLQQEIDDTLAIQSSPIPEKRLPLLFVLSSDPVINESLVTAAESGDILIQIIPISAKNVTLRSLESCVGLMGQHPDAILFRLPSEPMASITLNPSLPKSRNLWELWQSCKQLYPDVPLLMMGERGELNNRIQAIRWGAKLFLEAQTSPPQVIEAIVQFLERLKVPKKILILDGDQEWLCTLPTLLEPWDFQVNTLADPQQFWMVLQAITPDAVVLNVNMPQINGFEICQLLRSDPYWYQLPVLFLSDLTDAANQRQAFMAGADDFLCKPVTGIELANRLLNRLKRTTERVVSCRPSGSG